MNVKRPIFTIGHSMRPIPTFVKLLQSGQVELVIDVRTDPRSRRNPLYNGHALGHELAGSGIGYERIADLGGLRGRSHDVPPEVNAFWDNRSFHNYADYALSPKLKTALGDLLSTSSAARSAIMCAEAVWWRCHRRIIANYVLVSGRTALHLMGEDRVQLAILTPAAKFDGSSITYPRAQAPVARAAD